MICKKYAFNSAKRSNLCSNSISFTFQVIVLYLFERKSKIHKIWSAYLSENCIILSLWCEIMLRPQWWRDPASRCGGDRCFPPRDTRLGPRLPGSFRLEWWRWTVKGHSLQRLWTVGVWSTRSAADVRVRVNWDRSVLMTVW